MTADVEPDGTRKRKHGPRATRPEQQDTSTQLSLSAAQGSGRTLTATPRWAADADFPAGRPGQALPAPLQARLAPVVGSQAADAARVHTDTAANAYAAGRGALAVASGADIFFARGQYRPGTSAGDRLIAHEVAHVDQAQRNMLRRPAYLLATGTRSGPLEVAADQAASRLADGSAADNEGQTDAGTAPTPPGRQSTETGGPGAPGRARPGRAAAGAGPAQADAGHKQADAPDTAPAAAGAAPAETAAAPAEAGGAPAEAGGAPAEAGAETDTAAAPAQAQAPPPPGAAALPAGLPLMPAPAMALSPAERARVAGVQHRAHAATKATAAAPPATANVSAAQAAVQVPQAENDARAAEKVVADLSAKEKPSIEIETLCKRIHDLITGRRPADEEGVIDTRPQQVASEAGQAVAGDVRKNVDTAKASYGPIDATPQGPQAATPPGIEPIPAAAPAAEVGAAAAAPDAIPPDQVSLDKDAQAMQAKAHDAGLGRESAQLVTSGPIAEAREAEGDMKTLADTAPREAIRQQQATLAKSTADMAALQAKAVGMLKDARAGHASSVRAQQVKLKGGEEGLREELSRRAKVIYTGAQGDVDELLKSVPETAMSRWTAGLTPLSRQFNEDLRIVKGQVEERHSGIGGFFVSGWDALTGGPPGWIMEAYDSAEKNFGRGVCLLITEISSYVNTIIKIADGLIATAREEIHNIFTKDLPAGQKSWAAEQLKAFDQKLDALHDKAETARATFSKELIQNAGETVQAAREKVQQARKDARGIWGRFLDAVERFLDDPVKFVIDGLLDILNIPPPAFWAVVDKVKEVISDIVDDPMKFANNLMAGIGDGFGLFFDHIGRHLLGGLLDWLLSGLKQAGISIEIPKEPSLRNVVVFFLQLLGISWVRIRKLLVRELGEKPVALIEKAAGVIYTLATKDISGIFEDIKAMFDPKTIIDTIIQTAIRFITEKVIVTVAKKILIMLNPAGVILAAIEAIYRVLKWVFYNAARIFRFIEAVVNGMADVVAGNVSGLAKKVEQGLAMLVAPVIDFLADYLGFGDLPEKVAEGIQGLQAWVEEGLRTVIKWLVEMGKKTLAALGFKGKDEQKEGKERGAIGETLTFAEGGVTHHLYIAISGANATVMVSSAPMTVTAWLDGLQAKITGADDNETPQGAKALIELARSQLAATDTVADQAAAKMSSPAADQGAEPTQSDEVVDEKEQQLRDTLSKLGELFGEKPIIVRSLHLEGGSVDLSAIPAELSQEILGYRGPKTLVSRKTGPDYVKKLLQKEGTKAAFDAETGTLHLALTIAGELTTAASGSIMGRLIADDIGVAQVSISTAEAEFVITGNIDDASTEIGHGRLLLPWDDVESAGKERLERLAKSWTDDVLACRLKDFKEGKKTLLWDKDKKDFSTDDAVLPAGVSYLKVRYDGGEIKVRTLTQFKKLLEESTGSFKKDFQSYTGDEAAKKTRDFALPKATRDRIIQAILTIAYRHNDRYGLLAMPYVPPEPLPKEVREALTAALSSPPPKLDTSSPAELEITLEQADQLTKILQDAIDAAQADEPPNRDLIESLTRWKNLIVQPEMHHIVPEWLSGPEEPDVKLWVPRILHNFGEGPADPGFHQVLNGLLTSQLGFAEPGFGSPTTPRINDEKSVRYWLDQAKQNRARLERVLVMAYTRWTGSRAPELLDIVKATIAADLKAYEEPKGGGG